MTRVHRNFTREFKAEAALMNRWVDQVAGTPRLPDCVSTRVDHLMYPPLRDPLDSRTDSQGWPIQLVEWVGWGFPPI
jgi:hypothetical protein